MAGDTPSCKSQKVYVDLSDKLYKVKSQLLEEMSMKALDLQ